MSEKILSAVSILLLIFCMLALLKRSALPQKHRIFRYLSRLHAPCGILLLIAGLFHGILAGSTTDINTAAMITGKLTWFLILALIILSLPKKKTGHILWRKMHISLAVSVSILTMIHIGFTAGF